MGSMVMPSFAALQQLQRPQSATMGANYATYTMNPSSPKEIYKS